jgi:hypothetical protein
MSFIQLAKGHGDKIDYMDLLWYITAVKGGAWQMVDTVTQRLELIFYFTQSSQFALNSQVCVPVPF